jgi:hypothetical protein
MKLLLALGAALACFGCASGPAIDVPEEVPTEEASPRPPNEGPARFERAIERVNLLERCPACGPVPDPWDEVRGPVPDPWIPPQQPERP